MEGSPVSITVLVASEDWLLDLRSRQVADGVGLVVREQVP